MVTIVYIVTAVVFILCAPLNFSGYIYFDKQSKRLSFGIYLYGFIKVFGGYTQLIKGGVIIHYANKKARLFLKRDMGNFKIKLKDLKSIEVFSSKLVTSFPCAADYANLASCITVATNFICPFIVTNKDFIKLNSTVILGRDEDLKAYYKISVGFNLSVILKILVG